MKLIRRENKIDPETFAPFIELTLHVPIETIQDSTISQNELAATLGTELIEYLTQRMVYQLALPTKKL